MYASYSVSVRAVAFEGPIAYAINEWQYLTLSQPSRCLYL